MGESDCKYVDHRLANSHTVDAKWHFRVPPNVEAEEEKYDAMADNNHFILNDFD